MESISSNGSFTSALQAFFFFNDCIYTNGATCFGTSLPQSLGLLEANAGTFIGTRTYADGTTLGISIGPVIDGTQIPIAVGFELRNSVGTELARTDWNTGAKHEYDRNPHHHFLDSPKRQYLNTWPDLRCKLDQYFNFTRSYSEGTSCASAPS